jgi:Beta/Gamma crystallin
MAQSLSMTLIVAFCTVSSTTLAQSLTLYSGTNFSGESKQVSLASANVGGFIARSAVATGPWRVCSGPLGLFGCRTIEGRVADLGGSGLTVVSAVFGIGTQPSSQPQTNNRQVSAPQSGVLLFSEPNFAGRQQLVTSDISSLNSLNFGDDAKSAMVAANESWQLCEHSNYGGSCFTLQGSMPNLGNMSGNGSSLRRGSAYPQQQGQYPVQYPTTNYPAQVGVGTAAGRTASFFAQPLFNGQPMLACPDNPSKPSSSCAKKSAEQFCRLSGFSKLAYSAYSVQGYLEDVLCAR